MATRPSVFDPVPSRSSPIMCIPLCFVLVLQLKERKLKDLEKDYPAYLEQQAELEDPVKRLEVCAKTSVIA